VQKYKKSGDTENYGTAAITNLKKWDKKDKKKVDNIITNSKTESELITGLTNHADTEISDANEKTKFKEVRIPRLTIV